MPLGCWVGEKGKLKAKEYGQMPGEAGVAGKHISPAALRRTRLSTLTIPINRLRTSDLHSSKAVSVSCFKATKYTVICSGSNKEGRQMPVHKHLPGVDIWELLYSGT